MRDIKFRGLNTRGKWVYGSLVQTTSYCVQHSKTWIVETAFGNGGWFNVQRKQYVRPATVGEITNCRDKNEREIYEGDIISELSGRIYKVEYLYDTFGAYDKDGNGMRLSYYCPQCEVIGNIYENPELLGGYQQ